MRTRHINLWVIVFVTFFTSSIYASGMPEFLCELGLKFYHQGRYAEALHEFRKALIVEPNYEPAIKYIQIIEEIDGSERKETGVVPVAFKPSSFTSAGAIKEILDLVEMQREMVQERQLRPVYQAGEVTLEAGAPKKKISPPQVLILDESLAALKQPFEIELGKSIIVAGHNIQRFLVTDPDIITVEKRGVDEILVTGKNIGYTYLHVWDDSGRWTLEWLGILPKPEGPSYEELMRREEERAQNFKIRYALDWLTNESGRRIYDLKRSGSYSWTHNIGLTGETPYGNLDTQATVRHLKTTTDLTYATLGLTDGKIGPFKGFTFRGGDYAPYFSNLAFPGAVLRGTMLVSPIWNKKLEYNAFWGRESGGSYGLSPELYKSKHSFVNGVNLSFTPTKIQNYKLTMVHGWGRDRESYLNRYGYDLSGVWNFDRFGLGYEIAQDSQKFGHLLNMHYSRQKLNLTAELRNINKDYVSILGNGWRQGELGGWFNLNYALSEKVNLSTRLDVYQDRLYPAQDNERRLNEDLEWNMDYRVSPNTSWNLNYMLQNDLGKLSQARYQAPTFGISRQFSLIRDIYTYFRYSHQENKNFSSPSLNYINDKIYAGMRFSLIGELYYYINKEINWLHERYAGEHSLPNALETGLDYSGQLGQSPFYGYMRFTYRDEEDASSSLSFLSGEDYIEGYSELRYRPNNDNEFYGSCRIRNSWADNSNVVKRFEANFNAGMRHLWNTGLRWEAVCNIEGYIFRDLNSDGLRQRDEPPVEGVRVWLGKDKSEITDIFGYYQFKGIRGRKAYVSIDMATLPSGYLLTVPNRQEVAIIHNQTIRADFGMMAHSEINGVVFEDQNGNGKYDKQENGVENVVVTLDSGKKIKTDSLGRYSFANVSAGEYALALDLNTLPIYYLPKAALVKKITLFEGVTYVHNIPLKRVENK